jgi:hypothetical protein
MDNFGDFCFTLTFLNKKQILATNFGDELCRRIMATFVLLQLF